MRPSRSRRLGGLLVTAIALIVPATCAHAAVAQRVVTLSGDAAPGTPPALNKVRVLQIGNPKARHVLVLNPGTSANAGYFAPVARDIARRAKGWQVWAVERRENLLEDQSMLDQAKRGQATTQQLFDYYLGWIGTTTTAAHFVPKTTEETAYARAWGMSVAMNDLRRVVRAARRGGRTVVLGGHSLGGTMTVAYATWDFHGKVGGDDLSGLVLIDGGSYSRGAPSPDDARASLAELAAGSPFLDLTGLGLPWSAGTFNVVGSESALLDPDGPAILQPWSLLPADLKPPVPATNLAGYGYALDVKTGPKNLALVQVHAGHLADSGDPRGWVNDGLTTPKRAAQVFSGAGILGMDGTAWYHPRRLTIDSNAVNLGIPNPAQKVLDVRAIHGDDVHVPIYAYETALGQGRVLSAARALARRSHLPASKLTLVDRTATNAHVDPIADLPAKNDFLKTVVPFLKRIR